MCAPCGVSSTTIRRSAASRSASTASIPRQLHHETRRRAPARLLHALRVGLCARDDRRASATASSRSIWPRDGGLPRAAPWGTSPSGSPLAPSEPRSTRREAAASSGGLRGLRPASVTVLAERCPGSATGTGVGRSRAVTEPFTPHARILRSRRVCCARILVEVAVLGGELAVPCTRDPLQRG
jgi:hypothetical protein